MTAIGSWRSYNMIPCVAQPQQGVQSTIYVPIIQVVQRHSECSNQSDLYQLFLAFSMNTPSTDFREIRNPNLLPPMTYKL